MYNLVLLFFNLPVVKKIQFCILMFSSFVYSYSLLFIQIFFFIKHLFSICEIICIIVIVLCKLINT